MSHLHNMFRSGFLSEGQVQNRVVQEKSIESSPLGPLPSNFLNCCKHSQHYTKNVTGGNDPRISSKMAYANLAKNGHLLNRHPVGCSTVKYVYSKNGILLSKIACS